MSKKLKEVELIQQGDVLIFSLDGEPDLSKCKKVKPKNGFHILAEGEVTGHAHRVKSGEIELFEDENGTLYCRTVGDKEATVTHEEHKQAPIKPNTWHRIRRVVEYDPFEDAIREVSD